MSALLSSETPRPMPLPTPTLDSNMGWKPGFALKGSACWAVLTLHFLGLLGGQEILHHFQPLHNVVLWEELREPEAKEKRRLAARMLIPGDHCFQPAHHQGLLLFYPSVGFMGGGWRGQGCCHRTWGEGKV